MKNISRKIQSNQNKVIAKAKMINLGIALDGCPVFVAVPYRPGQEPERIAQGIRAEIVQMIERQKWPTIRDIYEHTILMQSEQMEN